MTYIDGVEIDTHAAVAPVEMGDGHGAVTAIYRPAGDDEFAPGINLFVCLHCGLVSDDTRYFAHVDCTADANQANRTWADRIEAEGFPDPPTDDDTHAE